MTVKRNTSSTKSSISDTKTTTPYKNRLESQRHVKVKIQNQNDLFAKLEKGQLSSLKQSQ